MGNIFTASTTKNEVIQPQLYFKYRGKNTPFLIITKKIMSKYENAKYIVNYRDNDNKLHEINWTYHNCRLENDLKKYITKLFISLTELKKIPSIPIIPAKTVIIGSNFGVFDNSFELNDEESIVDFIKDSLDFMGSVNNGSYITHIHNNNSA